MQRVTVFGRDDAAMRDLVRRFDVDIARWTLRRTSRAGGAAGWAVDAVVDAAEVVVLEAAGYAVTVIEDAAAAARERAREIEWHPLDVPGGAASRLPR